MTNSIYYGIIFTHILGVMMTDQQNFRDKYLKTNALTRFLLERFFKHVGSLFPESFDSVHEIGCGEGFSMQRLYPLLKHARISASDVDPALVASAQERNRGLPVQFFTESVYQLNEEDASIDLVLLLEVLEHLEDYRKALQEIIRITRGAVIISVPWEPWWRLSNMARGKYLNSLGNTPGHINHWSKKSFTKILGDYALVQHIEVCYPWIIARMIPRSRADLEKESSHKMIQ